MALSSHITCFIAIIVIYSRSSHANSAACYNNISGSYQSDKNANPDFEWATSAHNLTIQIRLNLSYSCGNSERNNETPIQFDLFIVPSSPVMFGSVQFLRASCDATANGNGRNYFSGVSMDCYANQTGSNIAAFLFIIFENPTMELSGKSVQLTSTSSNSTVVETGTILIKNCPTHLNNSELEFYNATGRDLALGTYRFGNKVGYRCKRKNGVVFSSNPSQTFQQLELEPYAVCGPRATWEYKPSHCWSGHTEYLNKPRKKHHVVRVINNPVLFICKNSNSSVITRVQIKLNGKPVGRSDSMVTWKNISFSDLPHFPDIVPIECVQYTREGKVGITNKLQILHKRVHLVGDKPLQRTVYQDQAAVVTIPVIPQLKLTRSHLHIKKEGEHKYVSSFQINTNGSHHLIEVHFAKVTQADIGKYQARIAVTPKDVFVYKFELVEGSDSLSTGAKVAVALTVVGSFVVIAVTLGYLTRKFMRHRKELREDGERVMIIEDNDDNDDVFHDPTRAARFQEELLRSQDEPSTSGHNDETRAVEFVGHQNKADRKSLDSDQRSECFVLDDSKNSLKA